MKISIVTAKNYQYKYKNGVSFIATLVYLTWEFKIWLKEVAEVLPEDHPPPTMRQNSKTFWILGNEYIMNI